VATGTAPPVLPVQDRHPVQLALDAPPEVVRPPRQRERWERGYVATILATDLLSCLFGVAVAFVLEFGERTGTYRAGLHLLLSALLPVVWVLAMASWRAYETRFLGIGSEEFKRVTQATIAVLAFVATLSYATMAEIARGYVLLALPMAAVLTLLGRYAARKRLHAARYRGKYLERVVAVGHERTVLDLVQQVEKAKHAGMQVVGACLPVEASCPSQQSLALLRHQVPVLGCLEDVLAAVERVQADAVAVTACDEMDGMALRRLSWKLQAADIDLVVAPTLMEVAGPRIHIRPVSGLSLLHVEAPEFTGGRRIAKGIVDRGAAALALLLLSPLLIGIAIAVRTTSPGPALFRQTRVGRNGEEFTMLKFRSMAQDAEHRLSALLDLNERKEGLLFKIRDDPRVTRVGAWLRRFSLDELPQLFNVLNGSMSLVGPRPPLPSEVEQYHDDVRRRLLVKPGLTGLWQVSGRSDLSWDESVRLDLRYVENWSLALDVMILWKTASAVLRHHGAY